MPLGEGEKKEGDGDLRAFDKDNIPMGFRTMKARANRLNSIRKKPPSSSGQGEDEEEGLKINED